MDDYISISTLNDFIFCPYSIYLHNVYMETDDSLYHATPQTKGRVAHESIDKKTYSTKKNDLMSLPVYSAMLGVMGKIDLYHQPTFARYFIGRTLLMPTTCLDKDSMSLTTTTYILLERLW